MSTVHLDVSDPQRLTIQEVTIRGYARYLTQKGLDAHEFATSYVKRTEMLGYPPSIAQSVHQFLKSKGVMA